MNAGELTVKCLVGISDAEAAEAVGQSFAAVSAEQSPLDRTQLPAYLPSLPPPQVHEWQVLRKLENLKNTRSTLDIDIENKLRKEVSVELVTPLTNIINTCLKEQKWPQLYKHERVTPVPKVQQPETLKDLRKISCTSDYNKLLEGFLKDFIIQDVGHNIDLSQYGGKKGVGTEHMMVALVDRILKLLDSHPDRSAVILAGVDWANAFARGEPTTTLRKFISMGLRPSLVPLLADYFSNRKMTVRYNSGESSIISLIGGFPEGSLVGQDAYIVASNDCADSTEQDDRFRYIDDLEISDLVSLAGILYEYDVWSHVPSDVGIDQKFLHPQNTKVQGHLNFVQNWTTNNLMKINSSKSNYMVFSRSKEDFATRLTLNDEKIDRKSVNKILGLWLTEDAGNWQKNISEICKKAYGRISMLTKLKYAGVSIPDLLDIYCLFVRSCAEYCSVVFHSSLTQEQSKKIENIQKTSLKIILRDNFVSYEAACEMAGLQKLDNRRQARLLVFAKKCVKHPQNSRFFPHNENYTQDPLIRKREPFHVNFSHGMKYLKSTIPTCQRLLNDHYTKEEERQSL